MQEIGKISPDAAWSDVQDSFDRALMGEILATPEVFRLNEYAYGAVARGEE